MDYGCEPQRQASAGCKVRGMIGVHDRYDLALLEVEPSPEACPLVLSSIPPAEMRGRPVYMVSYPGVRRPPQRTGNRLAASSATSTAASGSIRAGSSTASASATWN